MLAEKGLKATSQRMLMLEVLLTSKQHPSADNIFECVKNNIPGLSLGTVYKTLETFVEHGLVHQVLTNEGFMRYDGNTHKHNHIYCVNTNEILDYKDDELETLLFQFFKEKNIQNLSIQDIKVQINAVKIDPNKNITIH